MGLDIYLFRVSKINVDRRRVYTREDLEESGWRDYSPEDVKEFPKSLADKCVELKVKIEYYNTAKILKENNLKEDLHISVSSFSNKEVVFSAYPDDGDPIRISISHENLPKYLFSQINKRYVVKMDEVDYQRKGLNDEGWSLLPENCEYCDDKARIKKMCEVGGLSDSFMDNWVDDETVFYAWW